MNKFKMITAGLLIAILPMTIYAAGPRNGNGMRGAQQASFTTMDSDGDAMVTQQEFEAFRQARMAERAEDGRLLRQVGNTNFADVDSNADGVWSKEEFATYQAQQMQKNRTNQNRKF